MASIHDIIGNFASQKMQTWFGILIALGAAAALLANIDPHWYWPGLYVSVAGLVLHVWVMASIRSRKLVPANGPYKFVRHPKYISLFVYILGLLLMLGKPWLLLVFVPVHILYAIFQSGREERDMQERFGTEFYRYQRDVPRFLPSLTPYEKGRYWYFSMKHFQRQYGEIFVLLSLVFYAAAYVIAFHLI